MLQPTYDHLTASEKRRKEELDKRVPFLLRPHRCPNARVRASTVVEGIPCSECPVCAALTCYAASLLHPVRHNHRRIRASSRFLAIPRASTVCTTGRRRRSSRRKRRSRRSNSTAKTRPSGTRASVKRRTLDGYRAIGIRPRSFELKHAPPSRGTSGTHTYCEYSLRTYDGPRRRAATEFVRWPTKICGTGLTFHRRKADSIPTSTVTRPP